MALSTRRFLLRSPLFLNLAFSSFHEWLPSGLTEPADPNALVEKSREARISKICFLRHGKTAKAKDGVDFNRLLTDEGRQQSKEAGVSFGNNLKPFYPLTLVSPAPRTMETADIFLQAAGAKESTTLSSDQRIYDGTIQPNGSELFQKLAYATLRDYLDCTDITDRQDARVVLGAYAHTIVKALIHAIDLPSPPVEEDSTLMIVGHAIYLPAAALGVASLIGCDEQSTELLLSTSTQEAEEYLMDLNAAKVSHLKRPSKLQ